MMRPQEVPVAKHTDALKPFTEFKAPWESETGENEIDKPTLKKYIYNLLSDKAKAQDARDEALEKVATAEQERDEAKKQAGDASGEEARKALAKAEKERDEYKAKAEGLEAEKAHNALRAEVIGDLDPKYAKYVTGSTKEELEKSLESVKADFGLVEGEDGDKEDEVNPFVRPRTDLINPIVERGAGNDAPVDYEKVADQILTSRPF